jgi:hypothetical protein
MKFRKLSFLLAGNLSGATAKKDAGQAGMTKSGISLSFRLSNKGMTRSVKGLSA